MKWKRNKKEKEMTHEAETDEIFEFSERLRIQTFRIRISYSDASLLSYSVSNSNFTKSN